MKFVIFRIFAHITNNAQNSQDIGCLTLSIAFVYFQPINKNKQNGDPFWMTVNCSLPTCDGTLKQLGTSHIVQFSTPSFTAVVSACNADGCAHSKPVKIEKAVGKGNAHPFTS